MLAPRLRSTLAALVLVGCGASPDAHQAASPAAAAPAPRPSPVTTATPALAAAPSSSAATPAASSAATPAATSVAPVGRGSLRLDRTVAAGKWPEGVAVASGFAWVAESGSRRLLRIPLDGEAPSTHVGVGRLPVQVVAGPDGKLYTLAQTDKTLWVIDPATSRARTLTTVPDCPESLAIDGAAAWVLQWSRCSSVNSSVVRVDLATGKQRSSPPTGPSAWAIGVAGGQAWVALSDGSLRAVDVPSVQQVREIAAPVAQGLRRLLVASPRGVFATSENEVSRTDPAQAVRTHAVTLAEPAAAIALDGDDLLVIGRQGTIWILDPATLATRKQLSSPVRDVPPHAIARVGERFLVTDHGPDGTHGRLLVLSPVPSAQ